jgi:hypothetical protein
MSTVLGALAGALALFGGRGEATAAGKKAVKYGGPKKKPHPAVKYGGPKKDSKKDEDE